mmetsp:Transcript_122721/g.354722  ORF Transcript_122721/g.354722 Transcript_122721/m.354722 type:complete len:453 (+) Transcript_122721:23-1381(+)
MRLAGTARVALLAASAALVAVTASRAVVPVELFPADGSPRRAGAARDGDGDGEVPREAPTVALARPLELLRQASEPDPEKLQQSVATHKLSEPEGVVEKLQKRAQAQLITLSSVSLRTMLATYLLQAPLKTWNQEPMVKRVVQHLARRAPEDMARPLLNFQRPAFFGAMCYLLSPDKQQVEIAEKLHRMSQDDKVRHEELQAALAILAVGSWERMRRELFNAVLAFYSTGDDVRKLTVSDDLLDLCPEVVRREVGAARTSPWRYSGFQSPQKRNNSIVIVRKAREELRTRLEELLRSFDVKRLNHLWRCYLPDHSNHRGAFSRYARRMARIISRITPVPVAHQLLQSSGPALLDACWAWLKKRVQRQYPEAQMLYQLRADELKLLLASLGNEGPIPKEKQRIVAKVLNIAAESPSNSEKLRSFLRGEFSGEQAPTDEEVGKNMSSPIDSLKV